MGKNKTPGTAATKAKSPASIQDAALRYLASRSRTKMEMRRHLADKGFAADAIDALIADFCSYGYLNDVQYCQTYFRYAFGKGKGKRRVAAELREKGVDTAVIEAAFADYADELEDEGIVLDERARAREEADKVLRTAGIGEGEPVPEKILGRVGRKLASKGYSSDVIYGIIGELRR